MLRPSHVALLVLSSVLGCKDDPKPITIPANAAPASPDLPERDDAAATLRAYWPIAWAIETASNRADKCHDETPGFEATRACLVKARDEIAAAHRKLRAAPEAKLTCGKEIEAAHRKHADGRRTEAAKLVDWMDLHQGALRRLMVGRSIFKACSLPGAPCDDKPVPGDGFLTINKIGCVSRLFECSGTFDPCVYQVARQLGLPTDD